MKTIVKKVSALLLLTVVLPSILFSQNHQGLYMHIDYLAITNEDIQSFKNHISNTFIPIHEARKETGTIKSWYLYRVSYRGSQESSHNFVVITLSDHMRVFEDIPGQISSYFEEGQKQDHLEAYNRYLIPKQSELWRINNSVLQDINAKPSKYISMDYMNVNLGREYEYQMFEDEVAKPLHEVRMELDRMKGWELYGLITPGGMDYGYNFATGNYYDKLEHVEFGFTEEIIRQSHPGTNIQEFFDNIHQTRDLVRSEIWELVDYIK